MNPITNALTQGFSHQNILQYLLRHFPHAKKQIESALAKGFSAEKIIQFLQGGRKEVNQPVTEHEKTRFSDKEKQRNLEKNILKGAAALGSTAIGAYALSRALPKAGQVLQGQLLPALPQTPQIGAPQAPLQLPTPGQAAMQPPPPPQPQGPLPYTNPTAQGMRAPTAPISPQQSPLATGPQQPPSPPTQTPLTTSPQTPPSAPIAPLPKKLQDLAKGMLQAKKKQSPEEIGYALKKLSPNEVKDYEKTTGQPIARAIEEFAKQNIELPSTEAILPEKPAATSSMAPEPQEAEIGMGESKPLAKGATVALPSGEIGEISDIRQGIATVNAHGKEYRRKIEELIEPPMSEKDLADLYKDLISGIESKTGEEVSRMVNWAGYDPKTNELAFVPHLGALYVYDNISPDDAKELSSILSQRKSTGENFIGAWKEGSKSPIGAAMSRLIQKLQKERGGKGSEYKGKYEKIYDAFELPKIEAKAKHKEKENVKKRKTKKPTSH